MRQGISGVGGGEAAADGEAFLKGLACSGEVSGSLFDVSQPAQTDRQVALRLGVAGIGSGEAAGDSQVFVVGLARGVEIACRLFDVPQPVEAYREVSQGLGVAGICLGEVSGDMNPLHFDENYARGTIFRGRIAHGMLSVSYLSTVLGTKLPGAGAIFLGATVLFKAPVRVGDTVTARCTVREINTPKGRVIFDCICKVGETIVVEGEAEVKVPSRPQS